MKHRRSPLKVLLFILLGLTILVGGATTAYAIHFGERGLPGVTVAGESVTGLTMEETIARIDERAAAAHVEVTIGGHIERFALADLGFKVDAAATAQAAYAANQALDTQLGALVSESEIEPIVTFDEQTLLAAVHDLAAREGVPVQDATVQLAADEASYTVTPAVRGMGVDAEALRGAAAAAAAGLEAQQVSLEPVVIEPQVSTEQAQRLADAANALIALPVSIDVYGELVSPEATERAAWIGLPALTEGPAQPSLDEARIASWVGGVAERNSYEPTMGVQAVNTRGEVVSVIAPGAPGRKINNTDAVSGEVIAALRAASPITAVFTYDEVAQSFEQRPIADGAERLVHQAAPGEKWIDLNLSNNTVTAYEGATVVQGPIYIVPGMPGMETPTGRFQVYLKYQSQTMRGTNLDGTSYEAENVPWVTYFTGSIAFHGAPWRDSFGWSGAGGSHGCVNMPMGGAQFIYNWAPMGTVVVSHY